MDDFIFTTKLRGAPIGTPWDGTSWDGSNEWEFASAAGDTPDELYALWDHAVDRSRARLGTALADGGLDEPLHAAAPTAVRPAGAGTVEHYAQPNIHASSTFPAGSARFSAAELHDDGLPVNRKKVAASCAVTICAGYGSAGRCRPRSLTLRPRKRRI